MVNNYKIDIANGCHISKNDANNAKARGYNLWKDYFIKKENVDQEEAKDLSKKAQLTFSVAPSFKTFNEGLSLEQKSLLGLDN